MRQIRFGVLIAAWAAVFGAAPLAAQQADPAIQAVISNQLDAFKADDFGLAFSFASPMIKGIFGTPENFGAMVRQGYPMVWRPAAVRMLELREVGGALWQRVLITDQAGNGHVLDYQMTPGDAGWQINAVELLPEAGTGA